MRILIATGIYPPDIGGPATYTKELEKELPKRNIEIEVVSYSDEDSFGGDPEYLFRVNRNAPIWKRYFCYAKKVWQRRKEFDIIYVQDPVSSGVPVWLASKIIRKPYILKVVGDYAWEQGKQRFGVKENPDDFQKKRYAFSVELMRFLQKRVAKNAKKIFVPSNYLKMIVSHWVKNTEKIQVIYNTLDIAPLEKNKEELRKEHGLKGFTMLSVARLVPWKGFLSLMDVVSTLKAKGLDLNLYIIGEGPERIKMETKIKNLTLEKNIFLLGRKSHKEVLEYLGASDLFVLNTEYEGLSHLLLEATMMHCPILTTRVGGNPEAVKEGVNGILVSYNDKEALGEKIEMIMNGGFELKKKKVEEFFVRFEKKVLFDKLAQVLKT